MILLLACSCGGVVPALRGTLRNAGVSGWLDVPINQGKKYSLQTLDQFPEYYRGLPDFQALYSYIMSQSSFAVVIGYDADRFKWADIASGNLKSKIDAENIANHFANIQ